MYFSVLSSMLTALSDASYAGALLDHAKDLYNFAKQHRGTYSNSISNAASFYRQVPLCVSPIVWRTATRKYPYSCCKCRACRSSGDRDEMAWAAAWLHRATGDSYYLDDARSFYDGSSPWAYSWDDKKAGVQVRITSHHVPVISDLLLCKKGSESNF